MNSRASQVAYPAHGSRRTWRRRSHLHSLTDTTTNAEYPKQRRRQRRASATRRGSHVKEYQQEARQAHGSHHPGNTEVPVDGTSTPPSRDAAPPVEFPVNVAAARPATRTTAARRPSTTDRIDEPAETSTRLDCLASLTSIAFERYAPCALAPWGTL